MYPVRFIHAADLHLDTVFNNLSKKISDSQDQELHQSTFIALRRLVQLAKNQKVDFIILAGDTYNQEDFSLGAQIALRNACAELAEHNIQVFIAHGNHDPYNSRLKYLKWTDNVHVFSADKVEVFPVYRNEEIIAKIYGISHASANENRNLANLFHIQDENCLHLGVLHTSLNMESEKYAPCSLQDLKNTGLQYFALGHIHKQQLLYTNPFIAYSGSLQGLHIDEDGPKGCLLVTAIPENDIYLDQKIDSANFNFETKFEQLAPLIWQKLDIDLEDFEDISTLDKHLEQALSNLAFEQNPNCLNLAVRIFLQGRTKIDEDLRKNKVLEDLTKALTEFAENLKPRTWIYDIKVQTKSYFDESLALEREDLLGEILKLVNIWQQDQRSLNPRISEILNTLLSDHRLKRVMANCNLDYKQLLNEAKRVCIDILEKD